MMTNHGDELGTDRSQRHWRLVTVQAGGGLTVVRQRTRRPMQQLYLAGFLAKHSCTVAGIGYTRLGDDITSFTTSVKHAAHTEHARSVEAAEGRVAGSPGRPITSSWHSSGSSADRNEVWRGGWRWARIYRGPVFGQDPVLDNFFKFLTKFARLAVVLNRIRWYS